MKMKSYWGRWAAGGKWWKRERETRRSANRETEEDNERLKGTNDRWRGRDKIKRERWQMKIKEKEGKGSADKNEEKNS